MTARPTAWAMGRASLTEERGPAGTQMRAPASAIAGAPKTGMATNLWPAAVTRDEMEAVVEGWTVEQSMKRVGDGEYERMDSMVARMAASSATHVIMIEAAETSSRVATGVTLEDGSVAAKDWVRANVRLLIMRGD